MLVKWGPMSLLLQSNQMTGRSRNSSKHHQDYCQTSNISCTISQYTIKQWIHANKVTTLATRTPAFWYTLRHPMITHTRSQVKSRQSQSYKFKKLPKFQILKFCKKLYMRHTFWNCLMRCINMKWIQQELKALQSGHGMRDGRTDGRTETNNFVVRRV